MASCSGADLDQSRAAGRGASCRFAGAGGERGGPFRSSGTGGQPHGIGPVEQSRGTPGCNTVVRDHN